LVNFGVAMGVISVFDRDPTPFKSIRQAPHNRPRQGLPRLGAIA
jgi:hypothetical protein